MGIQPSVNNHTIPTNPIRYKIGLLPDSYLTIAIRQYYSAMPSDNRQTLSHPPPPTSFRPLLLPFTLFTLYTPLPPSSDHPSDPLPLPATFRNFPSTFHSRVKCKVPPALLPRPLPDPTTGPSRSIYPAVHVLMQSWHPTSGSRRHSLRRRFLMRYPFAHLLSPIHVRSAEVPPGPDAVTCMEPTAPSTSGASTSRSGTSSATSAARASSLPPVPRTPAPAGPVALPHPSPSSPPLPRTRTPTRPTSPVPSPSPPTAPSSPSSTATAPSATCDHAEPRRASGCMRTTENYFYG